MKLLLKLNLNGLAAASSAALFCLYMLSSCGLGTEVGNGAKEDGGNKKKSTQANNQSGAEPTDAENENEEKDSLDGALDYGIDMSILLNSCASPFETVYKSPFVLSGLLKNGKTEKITGKYDSTFESMTISDSKDKVLAKIKDDATNGDHKVLVSKNDGTGLLSAYLCSSIKEADDSGIVTYSVILTPKDVDGNADASKAVSTLVWVVDKTETVPELNSITVSSVEVELLKLESDEE